MDIARILAAEDGLGTIAGLINDQAYTIDLLRTCLSDTASWLERTNRGGTAHHRRILEVLAETEETN